MAGCGLSGNGKKENCYPRAKQVVLKVLRIVIQSVAMNPEPV